MRPEQTGFEAAAHVKDRFRLLFEALSELAHLSEEAQRVAQLIVATRAAHQAEQLRQKLIVLADFVDNLHIVKKY